MEVLKLSDMGLYHLMVAFFADGLNCNITLNCHGSSMSPFIRHDSILTLKPLKKPQQPRFGDIVPVAVHPHQRIIVHRIIQTKPPEYLVKGDNNKTCDGWFHRRDILGVVETIKNHNMEYRPRHWQNILIGIASKTGVLNHLVLPISRHLKQWIQSC